MLAIDSVVMTHQGCNETADGLTVIIGLVNQVPDGVDYVAGCGDIALAGLNLKVANLTIKGGG